VGTRDRAGAFPRLLGADGSVGCAPALVSFEAVGGTEALNEGGGDSYLGTVRELLNLVRSRMSIPERLEQTAQRAITRARETALGAIKDGRESTAAQHSARGVLPSGAFYGAVSRLTNEHFREYAAAVIRELIGIVKDVYGAVPPELIPWIREKFKESVETPAKRWAGDMREGK